MQTSDSLRLDLVERLRTAGCVFAEDETDLLLAEATSVEDLETMTRQRVSGLPLEHIVGWVDFCALRIAVDPGVFVPRQRTAFLTEVAEDLARTRDPSDRRCVVVDLCCGSGAIGAVLATRLGDVELHAADVDASAVACARRNLERLGGQVWVGDLFAALPVELRGHIDILTANTPYVPHAEIVTMPPEARLYEPTAALDGGGDGLDVQRALSREVATWLAPGGHVVVESSVSQAPVSAALFAAGGLSCHIHRDDDRGATVVAARRPRHEARIADAAERHIESAEVDGEYSKGPS